MARYVHSYLITYSFHRDSLPNWWNVNDCCADFYVLWDCYAGHISWMQIMYQLFYSKHCMVFFIQNCRRVKKVISLKRFPWYMGDINQDRLKNHPSAFVIFFVRRLEPKKCIWFSYIVVWYSYSMPRSVKRLFTRFRQRLQLPKMYNQICIDWITQFSCLVAFGISSNG